jgi:hypothetical protein
MPWPTSNTNTKNYDPFGITSRDGDKSGRNTASASPESVTEARRKMMDEYFKKNPMSSKDRANLELDMAMLDQYAEKNQPTPLAKKRYEKTSQEYKEAERETGLDPEYFAELLGSKGDWKQDLKAGALDALYGAAATGAGMMGAIPSPIQDKIKSQRDILKYRQELLRDYLAEINDEGRSPGTVISKAAQASGDLINPAGKLKLLNAAYHALRGFADKDSLVDAGIAGASNVAGEAAEDALVDAFGSRYPAVATFIKKIPGAKKLTGLPGNLIGGGVFEPALDWLADKVTGGDEEAVARKVAAEREQERIKKLREEMMERGERRRNS